jgi:hypothetical protein
MTVSASALAMRSPMIVCVDHRANFRHVVDADARIQIGTVQLGCKLANLSMGGAFLVGTTLPIASQLTLYIRIPMLDTVVEAPCSVRWSSSRGTGVQFDGLRAVEAWAIGKFIVTGGASI